MKKKEIIELQKQCLDLANGENLILQKYVEKLLSDNENLQVDKEDLQAIMFSIEERNKQETETEKDLKIENLKSIIEDCKIELQERRNKMVDLRNEIVRLQIHNKDLNSIIEKQRTMIKIKSDQINDLINDD